MPDLFSIFLVALGGALGSVSRFLIGGWVQAATKSLDFPFGTLTVNLAGCFIIGILAQLAESSGVFTPQARAFLFIGILGGFTTFSSFANESVNLMRDGEMFNALVNIAANVILGLFLVWLGRATAQLIWR
jgi:fluoride exporter